ncbi:hypothetical protein D3C85_1533730 [compost metagenome]
MQAAGGQFHLAGGRQHDAAADFAHAHHAIVVEVLVQLGARRLRRAGGQQPVGATAVADGHEHRRGRAAGRHRAAVGVVNLQRTDAVVMGKGG